MASSPHRTLRALFRGLAKLADTYEIEIGPLHARGIPAILLGSAAITLAAGAAGMLMRAGDRMPETLREARGLFATTRPERPSLNP